MASNPQTTRVGSEAQKIADRLRDVKERVAPYNPWPIGSDWWHKANDIWRETETRRLVKR